ncbi:hypothetical protein FQA39_LY01285 [Lamprigera yunnana]|nr:hypothetical protein FQA39_LY01285 [Lamprigera yunnana]
MVILSILSVTNIKSDSGVALVKHYGSKTICDELRQVRSNIDRSIYSDVDSLIHIVETSKRTEVDIPPLVSEFPLSYRSDDEVLRSSHIVNVGSTATSIEGLVNYGSSRAQQTGLIQQYSNDDVDNEPVIKQRHEDSFCISFNLRWQPLISSDRHVLESVEHSLKHPSDPLALLHSCEFFMDVLLQDFPAEIFLQRPAIVLININVAPGVSSGIISNCNSPYLSNFKLQHNHMEMENSELLKMNQLLLPKYCFITMTSIFEFVCIKPDSIRRNSMKHKQNLNGINLALLLLEELICLLNLCVSSNAWNKKSVPGVVDVLQAFERVLEKFAAVLDHFRLEVTSDECNSRSRTTYLQLVCSCSNLLMRLIPLDGADFILPRGMKNSLSNCLLDPSLSRLYPNIHETIFQFVKQFGGRFETDAVSKYKDVNQICSSISSAIKIFRNSVVLPVMDVIELANEAVASLEFHKNFSFITLVINFYSDTLPSYANEDYFQLAEEVVLKLLAHSNYEIQEEMYRHCEKRVIGAIGPKYNSTGTGTPGSQILFLLKSAILLEITLHGLTSANIKIQKLADNILVHILKCKILVMDNIWNKVVQAVIPIIAILACHSTKKTILGRTIVGILDPDNGKSLLIPTLEILKGNLCLLFVNDKITREEALSRLLWILTLQKDSRDLLPRLNSLQNKVLNNILHIQKPSDINRDRSSQQFYQSSALYQLLELLDSEGVEPMIRRSALTQVSVMLEDPNLHYTFFERNGINVITTAIHSALTESNYRDYVDCLIPSFTILRNVCLYNASVRQKLSNNFDLLCNILRGLFVFCTEERVQSDSSTLLYLLLYNVYVLGSPLNNDLSVPYLTTEKLAIPFCSNVHWRTSKHTLPELSTTLFSDRWCQHSIQIHWNSEWFGGFSELLKWQEVHYTKENASEFNKSLYLTNSDLQMLKSSSINFGICRCLNEIQNSTYTTRTIDNIYRLESYMQLLFLMKGEEVQKDVIKLPWELTFHKFLNTPPGTQEEMSLLTIILKFLGKLVHLFSFHDETCWITNILKTATHVLPNLLQIEAVPDFDIKLVHQELINLITACALEEQHYLDLHSVQSKENFTLTWLHVINIIADNLRLSETQHFYNLSYLDCMLSCLVHLTTALGWSNCKKGHIPQEPIPDLTRGLCKLISVFHGGKGSSAAHSLMGLSITRNIVLILNHLVMEMQYMEVKGWQMCFISENSIEDNMLYNLCTLWPSRDTVLRAAVLQLLAGLAISSRAAIELIQQMKLVSTAANVWESMLTILLEHEEASIVRENAVNVLVNVLSHQRSLSQMMFDNTEIPIQCEKSNPAIVLILGLLEEFKFFPELYTILENLYCKSYIEQNGINIPDIISSKSIPHKDNISYIYSKNVLNEDHTPVTTKMSNSGMVATPSLLKNTAIFIYNLMLLAENEVITNLQEHGLIKMFFRCLTKPCTEVRNTKELGVYCDVIEMNTAICIVLSKAVTHSLVCLNIVLHTRDCINVLLSLLNPDIYYIKLPQLIYLRNKLWTEIFILIGTLLNFPSERGDVKSKALNAVTYGLNENGHGAFLQTLCEAISMNTSVDLQQSALMSLSSLLQAEAESKISLNSAEDDTVIPTSPSMRIILDKMKTPRSSTCEYTQEEEIKPESKTVHILWEKNPRNKKPKKEKVNKLEDMYFNKFSDKLVEINTRHSKLEEEIEVSKEEIAQSNSLMAGAQLCTILLYLYNASTLKEKDKKRSMIVNTLSSILCVSAEAKKLGLQNGLMEMIMQQLKELNVKLSLESVSSLRRIADKRRVCPLLKELGDLIGLITNFMLENESVKGAASMLGFADIIHKLWVWFCVEQTLLCDCLKMLCTYTTDCHLACQSLPLTSALAGSGPRKISSNLSLLHEFVSVIGKQMELISPAHDLTILDLVFHVLHNACSVLECRSVLIKTTLLQSLLRLHPAITKKQKTWENVELLWLEFLNTLTSYCEGQLSVAKSSEALEIVMLSTSSTKSVNRTAALLVLRNIAFHHPNRPRLINCSDFINILQTKLSSGTMEEKNVVVTIIWALIANNQRAKLILKCAGLDIKLQDVIKRLSLSPDQSTSKEDLKQMHFVLGLLREGEKMYLPTKIVFVVGLILYTVPLVRSLQSNECVEVSNPNIRTFKSLIEYQGNKIPFDPREEKFKGNYVRFSKVEINTLHKNGFVSLESEHIAKLFLDNLQIHLIEEGAFLSLNCVVTLDLKRNHIETILRDTFDGLQYLHYLDLSYNELSEIPDNVFHFIVQLKTLNISNNNLRVLHPNSFYNLILLEELDISYNDLYKINPVTFQYFNNLINLQLGSNDFEYLDLEKWNNLSSLKILNISGNNLKSVDFLYHFSFASNLTELYLNDNNLTQLNSFALRKHVPALERINISKNPWLCADLIKILSALKDSRIEFNGSEISNPNLSGIGCNHTMDEYGKKHKHKTTTILPFTTIATPISSNLSDHTNEIVTSKVLDSIQDLHTLVVCLFLVVVGFIVGEVLVRSNCCRRLRRKNNAPYFDSSNVEDISLLRGRY